MLKYKLSQSEFAGLDEGIRKLYKADGENYVLDLEGAEDTSGLKSALAKERESVKKLNEALKAWNATGKKPEEISELLKKAEEDERKRFEAEGNYKAMLDQVKSQHEKELKDLRDTIARYKAEREVSMIDQAATKAIAEAKGKVKLLLPLIKMSAKVVEENGKEVVQIFDGNGVARVNAKGEFLSIPEWVEELKKDKDYQSAFDATGNSGAGGRGSFSSAGSVPQNPWGKESVNYTEQARLIKNDPQRAIALAAQAGVKLSLKKEE